MISKIVIVLWTVSLGWTFLQGVADVSNTPPSGLGQDFDENVAGAAIMLSAIVHFLLWCAVAIPAYVLNRVFRKRDEPQVVYIQEPQRHEPALVSYATDPRRRPGQPRAFIEG